MAWMNGQRTVYCRYCGTKGHNRRTCPSRLPEAKAADAAARAARSCRWCAEEDHDIRKCQKRVNDYQAWYNENATVRRTFFEKMNQLGMTPGAIIAILGGDVQTNPENMKVRVEDVPSHRLLLVESVEWDNIVSREIPRPARTSYRKVSNRRNAVASRNPIYAKAMTPLRDDAPYDYWYREDVYLTLPEDNVYEYFKPVIVLPGGALKWENMPERWRNGISGTERLKW